MELQFHPYKNCTYQKLYSKETIHKYSVYIDKNQGFVSVINTDLGKFEKIVMQLLNKDGNFKVFFSLFFRLLKLIVINEVLNAVCRNDICRGCVLLQHWYILSKILETV